MTLAPGTALGAYEIVAGLGAGGMGEVYRARDTRLGREVALKLLQISRHDDPALRARFEREAQTLAALSHPHIAAIYDVIDVGDRRAIVMELVAGSTLAEVIARGRVPLRLAIGYAIDISDALGAAHAAGIVHRDLKPANVVITTSGAAKVLDFGLAKSAVVDDSTATERSTMAVTEDRTIVGTLGYLSPEQAHGRPADGRSDIFSFGAVLHELVSGRAAFHGDSSAALLSAVLRDDPPLLRTLDRSTPRSVERLVARCLEKDPRRRYQNVADVRAALEDLREDLVAPAAAAVPGADAAGAPLRSRVPRPVMYAAAIFGIGALAFAFGVVSSPRPPAVLSAKYTPFITEGTSLGVPVWSADGRTLAYISSIDGRAQIMLRGIGAAQSTQLTTQGVDGISLFWSPDGSRIYFTRASDRNLVSVSPGGGEPQLVATAVPEDAPGRIAMPAGGLKACISPDARTIVFVRGDVQGVRLWAKDLRSGETRALTLAGLPQPLANVQALGFSPDGSRLGVIASPTALNDARGVWMISWPAGSARLLFADAPYLAANPALSWLPDSRRFAMNGFPLDGGTNRLLIADIDAGTLSPLTGGKDDDGAPNVTRDGTRIAFVSHRSGLDLIQFPVDGGPPEVLLATSRTESHPDISRSGMLAYVTDADGAPEVRIRSGSDSWPRAIGGASGPQQDRITQPYNVRLSPDSQRIAVEAYGSDHLIWIYPTAGGPPVRLDSETTDQHGPSWSPDGNWIAYRRLRNGNWELVKAPLGGGPAVRLNDTGPGGAPTDWSPSGQWIAHNPPDGMHLISPDGSTRRVLAGLRSPAFRFSHDGSRLVAIRRDANRKWQLTIWDVAGGRELRSIDLALAPTADVQGMALSPDESRIIVGAGTATSDIWLLENFEPPASPWARWLRR